MGMKDYVATQTVNGKFICTGSIFEESKGNYRCNLKKIEVPEGNRTYLVSISLTMLSAVGGGFDEDDTIWADIFAIDEEDVQLQGLGGVWGHHFGDLPYSSSRKEPGTMRISSWVGTIKQSITFRVAVTGDDWVGASFFVMQL